MTTKPKITAKPMNISLDWRISKTERQYVDPTPRSSMRKNKMGFLPEGSKLQNILLDNPMHLGNPFVRDDSDRFHIRCYYTCFADDLPEGLEPDHIYYNEDNLSLRINLRRVDSEYLDSEMEKAIKNEDDRLFNSFLYLQDLDFIFTNPGSVVGMKSYEEYYARLDRIVGTSFKRMLVARVGLGDLVNLNLAGVEGDKIWFDSKPYRENEKEEKSQILGPLFKIEGVEVVDSEPILTSVQARNLKNKK